MSLEWTADRQIPGSYANSIYTDGSYASKDADFVIQGRVLQSALDTVKACGWPSLWLVNNPSISKSSGNGVSPRTAWRTTRSSSENSGGRESARELAECFLEFRHQRMAIPQHR